MSFQVFPPPDNTSSVLTTWLADHLRRYEEYLNQDPTPLFTEAPVNPEEGQIVRADGVGWNPGSGRGFYGYDNGTWRFLG